MPLFRKIGKTLALIFSLTTLSCGVLNDPISNGLKVDSELDHAIFSGNDSIMDPLAMKTDIGYDNIPNPQFLKIKSTLNVNSDKKRLMRFTSLRRLDMDVLELQVHETNPINHNELTIILTGPSFKMNFNYEVSGPIVERKIKTKKQELTLTELPNPTTRSLNGYLYFKGICDSGCEEEKFEIEGYFRANLDQN